MKKIAINFLLVLFTSAVWSQTHKKIFGYITDIATGEPIIGSTIWLKQGDVGTHTNSQGYYSLPVKKLPDTLMISCIGYQTLRVPLTQVNDSVLSFTLRLDTIEAVIIKRPLPDYLQKSQTSLEMLSSRDVRILPLIVGESDITRTVQTLPGVSPGTENTSGFFVRGGTQHQNLVLIDGVPLYYAYHLYGLFSVFNTDAINTAQFYRGGIPAQYNGKLSSVLDINMNEGNNQRISGQATLGILTTKMLLEGPLIKNKTSFVVTLRRSMFDLMPQNITNSMVWTSMVEKFQNNIKETPQYYFVDYSAKISHQINNRNSIHVSYFNAYDNYTGNTWMNNQRLHWGSSLFSLRWKSILSAGTFCTTTFYETNYAYVNTTYLNEDQLNQNYYTLSSHITERSASTAFESIFNQHKLRYGGQFSWYQLQPKTSSKYYISGQASSIDTVIKVDFSMQEQNLFLEDVINPLPKLTLQLGFNINYHHANNQHLLSFHPRFSVGYEVIPNLTLKGSFTSLVQPLHVIPTNNLGLPSDVWIPSQGTIRPAEANLYVLGLTYSPGQQWDIGIEAYYKNMKKILMTHQNEFVYANPSRWERLVESGTGTSKGIELIISKKYGKFNGWCSYTLSKTDRTFPNINFGRTFPFDFDRRHVVNLVAFIQLSRKIKIGTTWTWMSGQPVTLSVQSILDNTRGNFSEIDYLPSLNNQLLPNYHRLDVNMNYQTQLKKIGLEFNMGAYNVYNRPNPITAYRKPEGIKVIGLLPFFPFFNITLKY
ncbi:MAG TPA: TonB-dependent receptor [Bacteroidales bacterium]|nr:TonB-dependent receptor [Bacteroidales bacterium]